MLEKFCIKFDEKFKGYSLVRDAGFSSHAWDTLPTWTQGDYTYEVVKKFMKKLQPPMVWLYVYFYSCAPMLILTVPLAPPFALCDILSACVCIGICSTLCNDDRHPEPLLRPRKGYMPRILSTAVGTWPLQHILTPF